MKGVTGGGARLELAGGVEPLRRARLFVRLQAERCGLQECGDDAALAAAEPLDGAEGDAVPAAVQVGAADGGLLVAVELRGRRLLHLREHSEALLSGLSSCWGWEARPRGVHVWCRLGGDDAHQEGRAGTGERCGGRS
ncbi:hypothetical protein [Kineococcus esterisolvens]|uniref:hypothetical protein n=1 Tax=unclassified Kineococcus TaxID=2621656 RepID=UPI003D7CBDCF